VWAATTTVGGNFVFDRIEVEACGKVNVALLGLNAQGETDTQGEAQGSTIMALVKSNNGEIRGGSTTQSAPSPGYFATSQKYLLLNEGKGQAFIWYACDKSGVDTVEISLLERFRSESGSSYAYKQIASTSQAITIKPVPPDAKGLAIASFTPSETDMYGIADECSSLWDPEYPCGIEGYMTAGLSGGKILVKAKNEFAAGTVTLTVTYQGHGDEEVSEPQSYTANMKDGEAIVTLNNQLTKAGEYYLEATMEGFNGSSVGLVYPDKLKVLPTGTPKKLWLSSDKQRIANPNFTDLPADSQIAQGTMVVGQLVDAYGNMTSNCVPERDEDTGVVSCTAGGEINVTIVDSSDNDTLKLIFAEDKLDLHIPAGSATGMMETKTGDAVIGNESGELAWTEGKPKTGTIKLVATAKNSSGEAISTIANSDPLVIKVVDKSLSAKVHPEFQSDKLAGNTFDAFEVTVVDTKGQTIARAGTVTVKNTQTMEEYSTAPNHLNVVPTRFQKQTWGNKQYLISDAAGSYGQVLVDGSAIVPSVIKKVEFHNANGRAITDVPPAEITADKKYIVRIPEASLKMYDEFGNMLTAEQPLTSDKVGIFTVSTSNAASTAYPNSGNSSVPGRFMKIDGKPSHVRIVYDATGSKAFAGQDTIGLNFSRATIEQKPSLTSTIPAYKGLASIKTHLFAVGDTIPVSSEVAMTVEALNSDGKRFVDPDRDARTNVTLTIGGPEGDTVVVEPTVTEIWWEPMTVTEELCQQVEGTFTDGVCELTEDQCQSDILGGLWMDGKCQSKMERQLSDGETLDFNERMGGKVLLINAGPDKGIFSLTFTSDDNNEITETRTLNVSKTEPQACVPGSTDENTKCNYEEQCEAALGLFTDDQCKATSLLKAESSLGSEVDAAFGGGILAKDDNEGAYQQLKEINVNDPIVVEGVFKVNPEDVGLSANILVAVFHINPLNSGYDPDGFGWFQLVGCDQNSFDCPVLGWKAEQIPHGGDGLPVVSSMKPFDLVDSLPEYYTVPIYGGTLSVPGELWLYFGYSVKNTGGGTIGQSFQPGKIVRNVCPIMIVTDEWISDDARQYFLCDSAE
jgi:hypothetical protein